MDANFRGSDYTANFKDVVAKRSDMIERSRGRMVTPGADTKYEAGTVLGIVTATGRLKVYASGSSDGSQNPVGVLEMTVTVSSDGSDGEVAYIIKGTLYKDRLIGMDAGAITALGARAWVEGGENLIRLP